MKSTDDVTYGVQLPIGADTQPADYRRLTLAAEESGFDAVWLGEHIILPPSGSMVHPYSSRGVSPLEGEDNIYDMFQVLSYLAGITDRIKLGTHICVAPLRHPVLTTKNALTLDTLSDGRFEFGIGVGWLQAEFETLDIQFTERGSLTDEFLQIFELACTRDSFGFDGRHHSFDEMEIYPRPVQSGGPTTWIGGDSRHTFRRIAEYGDGWVALSIGPDGVAEQRKRLITEWREQKREGTPLLSVKQSTYIGDAPPPCRGRW